MSALLRTGEAIYWTATAVAGLIVALSVANYLSNARTRPLYYDKPTSRASAA